MYYIYMLRCSDNSIYTGITIDLNRRINEHITKSEKCAKYTLHHTVQKLEVVWETENRVLASKLEYAIKKMTKKKKEDLIKDTNMFDKLLEKLDCSKYKIYYVNNGQNDISLV